MSKIIFGKMLDYYRKKNNLTMEELGKKMGKTKSAVSRWISGDNYPKVDDIEKLTQIFNTDVETLIFGGQQDNNEKDLLKIYRKLFEPRQNNVYHYAEDQLNEQNNMINLDNYRDELKEESEEYLHLRRQRSAAGSALGVYDDIQDYEVLPASVVPRGADELVEITGDSMSPLINKGEDIYIHHQPVAENGQVAIVRIEDDGVTCKRVYKEGDKIRLKSENPDYEDMIVDAEKVTILGVVIF